MELIASVYTLGILLAVVCLLGIIEELVYWWRSGRK